MQQFFAPLIDQLLAIPQWHKADEMLKKLQASTIAIELTEPSCMLYFTFDEHRPHCSHQCAENNTVDVTLKMSWVNAALMSISPNKKNLHIEGDIEKALCFQKLFQSCSMNLEDLAAAHLPSAVAFPVQKILRSIKDLANASYNNVLSQGHHILVQEGQYTPSQQEVNEFIEGVDQLRFSIDKFAVKLHHSNKTDSG